MQPKHMPANWSVDYKHLASTRSEAQRRRKLKPRNMSAKLKVAIEQVSSSDSARSQPLKSSLKKKADDKEENLNESKKASTASFSVFNEMRTFLSRDFNFNAGSAEQPSLVNEPDRTSNSDEVLNTKLLLQDEDGIRKKNKSDPTRSSSVDPLEVKKTKSDGNLVVKKLTNSGKKRGVNVKQNLLEDLHCDPEPQIDAKNVCFKADSKAADYNQTDNIVQSEGVVQVDKEKGELLLTEKKGDLENENLSHVSSSFVGGLASYVEDDSVMLVLSPNVSHDNLKIENVENADNTVDENTRQHREDNVMRIYSFSSSSSITNADAFEIDQVVKSIDSENVLRATKQFSEMKKEVSFRSKQRSIFSDSDENILSCEDQKSSRSDEFYSLAAFESTEDVLTSNLTSKNNENIPSKNKTSSHQAQECNQVSSLEIYSIHSEYDEIFDEDDKQKIISTLKVSAISGTTNHKNSDFSSITTTSKSSDASYSMRKIPTKLSGKVSKRKLSSSSTTGLQYAVNSLNSQHETEAASSPINAELFSYVPNVFKPSSAAERVDKEGSALDEEPRLPYVSATDSSEEEGANKKLSVSTYTEISLSCAETTVDDISTDPSGE